MSERRRATRKASKASKIPKAPRRPFWTPELARGAVRVSAVLAVTALVLAGGRKLSAAVADAALFEVDAFELEGARFITLDEAVAAAGVVEGASVWDDALAWEMALAAHPLVRSADVRRRLPSTLVFVVEEEEPVALVPTPVLEPVDRDGRFLPLDPALHRLDLPVVRPRLPAGGEARPTRASIAPLTRALERLRADPQFFGKVSEVSLAADGHLQVRWGADPEVVFRFDPVFDPARVRDGVEVLAHALTSAPDRRLREIDLRFADQVVVR